MHEDLWHEHADAECIVALDGGSAIDCAKLMLVRTAHGCFDASTDILEGCAPVPPKVCHRAATATAMLQAGMAFSNTRTVSLIRSFTTSPWLPAPYRHCLPLQPVESDDADPMQPNEFFQLTKE